MAYHNSQISSIEALVDLYSSQGDPLKGEALWKELVANTERESGTDSLEQHHPLSNLFYTIKTKSAGRTPVNACPQPLLFEKKS